MFKNHCSLRTVLHHVLGLHIFKSEFISFSHACELGDKRQFVILLHFENTYLSQKSRSKAICFLAVIHRDFWHNDKVFEGQSQRISRRNHFRNFVSWNSNVQIFSWFSFNLESFKILRERYCLFLDYNALKQPKLNFTKLN